MSAIKKSKQVAAGGIAGSLCLLLMFLTGLFPFATYALPAMAGTLLVVVVLEYNRATAVMVYVSVALLSLFITPDKEAAMMFLVFFGYYPIVKGAIEKLRNRLLETVIKFVLFNGTVISAYLIAANLLGMGYLMEGVYDYGRYGVYALLLAANLMFSCFDRALTGVITTYIYHFRPKYIGKWDHTPHR